MKKSQIIRNILKYEDKRSITNDDITYGDILNEIVLLYPEAITDPDVFIGWASRGSGYHEEIMKFYGPELNSYLKDESFAKKYIKKSLTFTNCTEALNFHPHFLGQKWFAIIAIEKFFPDDFVNLHCKKWLNSKKFFEENKLNFNFTRRMNLFKNLFTEDLYLEIINENPYAVRDVPKHFINKGFLIKLQNLSKSADIMRQLYRSLPYSFQSDTDVLGFMNTLEYSNELAFIKDEALDKETYLTVVKYIKGSDALYHLGELLNKVHKKPWFDEEVIYQTLNGFSLIYKNHGSIRGDDFGGGHYTSHPIKDAFFKIKEQSPTMNELFSSDSGNKYFSPIDSRKLLDEFEKNLSTIMQDYEPCYRSLSLQKSLAVKAEKTSSFKL